MTAWARMKKAVLWGLGGCALFAGLLFLMGLLLVVSEVLLAHYPPWAVGWAALVAFVFTGATIFGWLMNE